MMEEETCKAKIYKSWEEKMYWTHFQCARFSQLLPANFNQSLAIPVKFTRNLNKMLPEIVTLKSPSGDVWEVAVRTCGDASYFHQGWQEFGRAQMLKEGDFLVFIYDGQSCFDVLIFDGKNMCEKETSYFVRKSEHKENDIASKNNFKVKEASQLAAEHSAVAEQDVVFELDSDSENDVNGGFDRGKTGVKPKSSNAKTLGEFVFHHGRKMTKGGKAAFSLASATVSTEGFLLVLNRTAVRNTEPCYMTIPKGWLSVHLPNADDEEVTLRLQKCTWKTRLRKHSAACSSVGLSAGWRKFVMDNMLEECDVCVFEPQSLVRGSIVLNVAIFRAAVM